MSDPAARARRLRRLAGVRLQADHHDPRRPAARHAAGAARERRRAAPDGRWRCCRGRRSPRSSRCATGTASARCSCATRPTSPAELVLATVILLLTGVESPFFYYTLATALLGGLLYGWPGAIAVLADAGRRLLLGDLGARRRRRRCPTPSRPTSASRSLYLVVAAAGAGARAAARRARRRPRTGSPPRSATWPREAERSRLARDMHDSLAKTVSGIGFAALGAGAADRARPARARPRRRGGWPRTRGRPRARRARSSPACAPTATRRALPLPMALKAEAERWAAGAAASQLEARRSRTSASSTPWRRASWSGSCARRCATRSATPTRAQVGVRLRTLGGRAVLTIADDGEGFEVPDDLEELAARAPLRRRRHARARRSSPAAT